MRGRKTKPWGNSRVWEAWSYLPRGLVGQGRGVSTRLLVLEERQNHSPQLGRI